MFKLFTDLLGYLFLLFMLLSPLLLLLGAYLIWKGSDTARALGWLLLLLVAYYQLHWISPWFVIGESNLVQDFKLHDVPFGPSPTVRWMEASNQLLLVPDQRVIFRPEPPEYNHVLVVDLEARKAHWQPKAEVNLDETKLVEFLWTGYSERRDGLSLYYASPSKIGPRTESSFVGFSLPILFYKIPWVFSEISAWQWEKTYFGWWREVLRESDSGPGVVEMVQILFNERRELAGVKSAWVMQGKFLILEPLVYIDRRVLVLGPFNTAQNTQSSNNKHKE